MGSPHDGVAISFWIISIAMIAATVFFFAEAGTVRNHWKTSLHVGGLVTLVAGVHYMYMREYWVQVHKSPIVYRYVDWSITVPLQMIEFNLILKAAGKKVSSAMFWKLLLGTVVMLGFGYAGEVSVLPAMIGFIGGMCGWAFILYEIFLQQHAPDCNDRLVNLPSWLLLRLPSWGGERRGPQCGLQCCGFCQQDRLRSCMLVLCQG